MGAQDCRRLSLLAGVARIHVRSGALMLTTFVISGATRLEAAAADQLDELQAALVGQPSDRAGVRLRGIAQLAGLLTATGAIGARVAPFAGAQARPVRAILFDKSASTNWSLGWHQDRTICVHERREVAGFGPWTVKSGMLHVAPPFALLERSEARRVGRECSSRWSPYH